MKGEIVVWGNDLEKYLIKIYIDDLVYVEFKVKGYSIEHALETACYSNIYYVHSTNEAIKQKQFRNLVLKARDRKLKYIYSKE